MHGSSCASEGASFGEKSQSSCAWIGHKGAAGPSCVSKCACVALPHKRVLATIQARTDQYRGTQNSAYGVELEPSNAYVSNGRSRARQAGVANSQGAGFNQRGTSKVLHRRSHSCMRGACVRSAYEQGAQVGVN